MKESDKDEIIIQSAYNELIKHCKRSCSPENKQLIEKAFKFANKAHKGVRRKSGEPYITHPIAVAQIAAQEMRLGTKSIVAALLHDVVEDTDYSVEDISQMFGEKVASIVDGLTKISGIVDQQTSEQAENFRKMILTLSDDLRVILLKLADRLHNMRTLGSMPVRKQLKIAGETLFLFAPLAHRMGLYAVKTELEDLSLKYEHPEEYNQIKLAIDKHQKVNKTLIDLIIEPIRGSLNKVYSEYEINHRRRSIYTTWRKMQDENKSLEEILNLESVLIVFKPNEHISEKNQCWQVYSMITDIYKPKPERIRDWVSTPKANGYEALHVTTMGPHGNWVEFHIRSERMNEIADRGFVLHSKNNDDSSNDTELDKWLKAVREILESPDSDAIEFLDEFRMNLFTKEIQVFTPKGQIRTLPKQSTALDFAYDIHTDVGNSCIGAKVNSKLVPLSYVLNSGDRVEVITSEKQGPQEDWINFVVTAKAKSNIKSAFKHQRREFISRGLRILEDTLIKENLNINAKSYRKLQEYYQVSSKDELHLRIGKHLVKPEDIGDIVRKKSKNKFIKYWNLEFLGFGQTKKDEQPKIAPNKKEKFIVNQDEKDNNFVIANCCKPIPGDKIMGYIEDDAVVTIHKRKCPRALKLMSESGDRIIETEWTSQRLMSFLAIIELKGIDKLGIVSDVTGIISKDNKVNMRSIHFESHDGIFEGLIHLYVHDIGDLNNLILKLIKIKGVDNVTRIENIEEYS
ncbi:MAG: RelA/SpoT family protein [Marinifilaceae bacterium]|jgi:GTP pyrophosphokinase|nr:RelA/SpoT family protein [Marinifilaceae bacterium]